MNRETTINETIQWAGAVVLVLGHVLNAIGPSMYPYNIVAFLIGAILFMTWSIRMRNAPQLVVNVISLVIGSAGLVKALAL